MMILLDIPPQRRPIGSIFELFLLFPQIHPKPHLCKSKCRAALTGACARASRGQSAPPGNDGCQMKRKETMCTPPPPSRATQEQQSTSATSPGRAVAFEPQRGDSQRQALGHGCVRGHARRLTSAFEGFIAVLTDLSKVALVLVGYCP